MLTNGELALLAPLFGLLGAVSGSVITWMATSSGTRRQQKIDANQQRYDRRADVYENMLIELTHAVMELEGRFAANPDTAPAEPDEQVKRDEARWRARAVLLASAEVRAAHRKWIKMFVARWEVTQLPEREREAGRIQWLADMGLATDEVGKAMASDLDALSALPEVTRNWHFITPREQG
jgi:hypothetical protein